MKITCDERDVITEQNDDIKVAHDEDISKISASTSSNNLEQKHERTSAEPGIKSTEAREINKTNTTTLLRTDHDDKNIENNEEHYYTPNVFSTLDSKKYHEQNTPSQEGDSID